MPISGTRLLINHLPPDDYIKLPARAVNIPPNVPIVLLLRYAEVPNGNANWTPCIEAKCTANRL